MWIAGLNARTTAASMQTTTVCQAHTGAEISEVALGCIVICGEKKGGKKVEKKQEKAARRRYPGPQKSCGLARR